MNLKTWKFPFYLNIRQKIIAGLTAGMLAIGFIAAISYSYLLQIEHKQHFAEIADDLSNIILEIRRYEKNWLLYGSKEDFNENREFIRKGLELLSKIVPDVGHLKGALQLNLLEGEFLEYQKLMEQMAGCDKENHHSCIRQTEDPLREHGKNLLELSQKLVSFERQRIFFIIKTLKNQLILSVIVFIVAGGFLISFVSQKIIHPLNVIEKTTVRIAQGDFSPLPVRDDNGDETQRVVEAFNRMIKELEKHQEQLVQAQKLSSIGILTSGIAHQLNNPLNNISTSCQIVIEELGKTEPEFLRKMLINIEQEVRRARDIVRGLLDFSRERDFALKPTLLSDVVERSIRLISSHLPTGIEIVRQIPPELSIDMDGQRMQEVFLNLMMNAAQSFETPRGQIKIAAGSDLEYAVITVEDTGTGIDEHNICKIFDPFFTTKEVGKGTGLGLSVVYGIIQKHEGTVSVESTKGQGARFIIRLPLRQTQEPEKTDLVSGDRC
ncbi:MAG: sensor histidine kinase [Desulfococcaceae bacterium]